MKSNQFTLFNIAGGCHGTYNLRADGTLSRRAVRALMDEPFGGWLYAGPAAAEASAQWRDILDFALNQDISPLDV